MPRRPRLNLNRGRNWLYHAAYFLLLAITAAVFLSADWHNSRRWLAVVCFLFLIAIRVLDPGPRPRTLAALVRSRFRLCPHCRYDLSALDNAHANTDRASPPSARSITCPECGRASTLADIRRHWRTDQGYSRSQRLPSRRR